MTTSTVILALVMLERLSELWLAKRNTQALLQQGAYEVSPKHYTAIIALHAAWLAGLWYLGWDKPINLAWLTVFALLQIMRLWVLATLGKRWTTRIIVLPGADLVCGGPYKLVAHPNYIVVIGEIAVLPLCFGLWWYAVAFSVLNALALTIRIRRENSALSELR